MTTSTTTTTTTLAARVTTSVDVAACLPLLRCGTTLKKSEYKFKKAQTVYVQDKVSLYVRGEYVSKSLSMDIVVRVEDGTEREVAKEMVFGGTDIPVDGIGDMIDIQILNEAVIMANLDQRFRSLKVYTFVGSILISVNPYRKTPIYTPSISRMYNGQILGTLPPHIYAIADAAYQSARREHRQQSILISGESGAGKTEAVKLIINYLTTVSTKAHGGGDGTGNAAAAAAAAAAAQERRRATMEVAPQERIVCSNPILEAFGNAKTVRNNNSSRFAKMVNVQLDTTGYIVGGHIRQFLLEKSRVVNQATGERNFHIFYYLMGGVDKSERAVWSLTAPADYRYTSSLEDTSLPDENLKVSYTVLKRAMTTGGISVHEQHLVLTLMAAILHLSNIRFKEDGDEARVRNMEVVKWTAHLLKCDADMLADAMTFDEAMVSDELVEIPLSLKKANTARDTLAMELYRRNFDWIVDKLNDDMKTDDEDTAISLLDIFGYEQYDTNRFEQFCINYANERVQHEFNEHIFRREVELYEREAIKVPKFTYDDNLDVLNQIEDRATGILTLLHKECQLSRGNDKNLLTKIQRIVPKRVAVTTATTAAGHFLISHYAGVCTYDVRGFVDANRGYFGRRLRKAMRSSRIPQFADLFADADAHDDSKREQTLSVAYRDDLRDLMTILGNSTLQYVRCIRPNTVQSAIDFDRVAVLQQLRATGLLNTVSIRKDGYPYKRPHRALVVRYEMLASPTARLDKHSKLKKKIEVLMDDLGVPVGAYQMGNTMVFLKDSVFHDLEGRRTVYYDDAAVIIQARVRGHLHRQTYRRKMAATKLLQYWFRAYLEAVDVSGEVGDVLATVMKSTGNDNRVARVNAVGRIGQMATRQANVDTIVDHGGITTILSVFNDDDVDDEMVQVGADALRTMSHKREHSQQIARGGAIKSMVSLIHSRDTTNASQSIDLLGQLSKDHANANLMVREGGLGALTKAMQRHTDVDRISDMNAAAPAAAMANATQSQRVAKLLGRDREAIRTVIEGVKKKPTYARLVEHSMVTLANLAETPENVDAIVELGGLDAVVLAMKHHRHNEQVMNEVARLVEKLVTNPTHAKKLGQMGGLDLAVASVREAPERCGEAALRVLMALSIHPENTKLLVKTKAVNTLLDLLATATDEGLVTWAMRMVKHLCGNRRYCHLVHREDGSRVVMDSMSRCTGFAEHNNLAIGTLEVMARAEPEVLDTLKATGVVSAVAHAMERHCKVEQVEMSGVSAMRLFATKNDVIKAMDVVGGSRMKTQTDQVLLETGHSLVIVSALALLAEYVDLVIDEGGVPIILSIMNGTASNVKLKITNKVLCPAIRALSRLLVDASVAEEFIAEAGVQTLVATIRTQCDKERVCDVCVTCVARLMGHNDGYTEAVKTGCIDALLLVFMHHHQWQDAVVALLLLLLSVAETKGDKGVKMLREAGVIVALGVCMTAHVKTAVVIWHATALLSILRLPEFDDDTRDFQLCIDQVLKALAHSPEHAGLALVGLQFLAALCATTEMNRVRLREKRAAVVVINTLDRHYADAEISALATKIISDITSVDEVLAAIGELLRLSVELETTPTDKALMERVFVPATLIGCMASSPAMAKALIHDRGLVAIHNALHATIGAKVCHIHERLANNLALSVTRLAGHRGHTQALVDACVMEVLLVVTQRHIDYENVVEEALQSMEVLSRSGVAIQYLIDIDSVPLVVDFVNTHPLNDQVLINGTRFVVRLAKGADSKSLSTVRKDGVVLAMMAVTRFMTADDHLIDALSNVKQLASLQHADSSVVIGSENMKIFLRVFQGHENSPSVMIAVMRACSALATDKGFVAHFVSLGMLKCVTDGLDRYSDNEEFCAAALDLLSKLPTVKVNLRRLEAIEAHTLVMETVTRHADSELVPEKGVQALRSFAAADERLGVLCAEAGGIRVAFNAVRRHPLMTGVVYNGMCFALELSRHKQLHKLLATERTNDMVGWTMRAYPKNAKLMDVCTKIIEQLVIDPKQRLDMMKASKKRRVAAAATAASADESRAGAGGDGGAERVPTVENLEQLEHRQLLTALLKALGVVRDPVSSKDQLIAACRQLTNSKAPTEVLDELIRQGGLAQLVYILEERCADDEVATHVLRTLVMFKQTNHINVIVAYGGIGALIKAMKAHMMKSDALGVGIRLLSTLSVHNRLKVLIGLHDGVSVLLTIMERYLSLPTLLNGCIYCLGNLAANCLPNRRAIVKKGGVNLISFAMQKHRSFLKLVINTARTLSPLCTDDKQARIELAKDGGSLVLIRTMMMHPQNPSLLQNGLNCLHKISSTPATLAQLIHQGAVQAIIGAMKSYPDNSELLCFAMEILSHLATNQSRETFPQLTGGGAIEMVITVAVRHHSQARIQEPAFSILASLCATQPKLCGAIVNSGFVTKILESLSRKSTGESMQVKGLTLLAALADSEMHAKDIVDIGAAHVITLVMRYHALSVKVIRQCLVTLAKLSITRDHVQILAEHGVVQAVVEALLGRADDVRFLVDALRVLMNMAVLENNAIIISETACDSLIKCVENHFTSHPFLRMFYAVLNNLTMWPGAARHLIEHNTIPIVLSTIKATANYPGLVARMIKVLTNMCDAGETAKRTLTNDGAAQLTKQMVAKHASHTKLVKQAEAFLEKLGGRNRRGSTTDTQADLFVFVNQYVPEHDRNLLRAGQVFHIYTSDNKPQKYHVKVTLDFRGLVWNSVKGDEQDQIPIRFVNEVRPGACTADLRRKKFNTRKADPECSFALFDIRNKKWGLSLEADDKADAVVFVNALQNLLEAYANYAVGISRA